MFDSIEAAIEDLKKGKLVIVVDDENRENEGDLIGITEFVDSDAVNFMATHARGLICTPISKAIADKIGLAPMVTNNTDDFKTAFTVTVDHKSTTTGISAKERFMTMEAMLGERAESEEFNRPGHVFPLIAKEGGVLERRGHTEAATTLAKLSGAKECAVICEIMNDDGTMARVDDLSKYKEEHHLKIITIEALVEFTRNKSVALESEIKLPTKYGDFKMYGFVDRHHKEHLALVHGERQPHMNVRIHSECLTGDVFGSERCDCGSQLEKAMEILSAEDGVLLYMRQEGRGIGLMNKLKAYELIEAGFDTVSANEHLGFDADLRTYDEAAAMLNALGVQEATLLSNNPKKIDGLTQAGIKVHQRQHITEANVYNQDYLKTKKEKLGHLL
jgi:3,4-dihydroxy 2-butanone 4-phosphate synthase/GTP cyclohydrolase II